METAHFYWDGELSVFQRSSLASFVRNNFVVNLWTYTDDIIVPPGVNVRDAGEVLDESWIGKYQFDSGKGPRASEAKNKYALFADLFRLKLISEHGGWWFDLDCFCLKDSQEFSKLSESNEFILGLEAPNRVNATVINFNNLELAAKLSEHVFSLLETSEDRGWGFTGPKAITRFLAENNLLELAQPMNTFYPISFDDYWMAYVSDFTDRCLKVSKESYVYHWWSSMNSSGQPLEIQSGSFLEKLFDSVRDII